MTTLPRTIILPLFAFALGTAVFAGSARAEDAAKPADAVMAAQPMKADAMKADPMQADCMKKAEMETDAMKKKSMEDECSKAAMSSDAMSGDAMKAGDSMMAKPKQ